jgi:hypothetical protein
MLLAFVWIYCANLILSLQTQPTTQAKMAKQLELLALVRMEGSLLPLQTQVQALPLLTGHPHHAPRTVIA